MLPSFMTQAITRVRPGKKTERGSAVPDWDNADSLVIGGCTVQPASTALSQDGRVQGVSDGYTVYAPPSADIAEGDRIILPDGKSYTINGAPRSWPSATGTLSHMMLSLARWSG